MKGLAKNGVAFWKAETLHPHTVKILARATAIGATPPSNIILFDNYVRSMVDIWTEYCDVFFRFRGTGDANFKRINLANPESSLADFYGGYTLDNSGIKGNGINAYVDTNFNPSLLVPGQKYQLNDASTYVLLSELSSYSTVNKNFPLLGYTSANSFFNSICTITNANQRLNNNTSFNKNVDFNTTGLKGFSRFGNGVLIINKDKQESITNTPTSLPSTINLIGHNLNSTYNSNMKISSSFLGKSIPFEVSQTIRAAENADMANLGLPQIA